MWTLNTYYMPGTVLDTFMFINEGTAVYWILTICLAVKQMYIVYFVICHFENKKIPRY